MSDSSTFPAQLDAIPTNMVGIMESYGLHAGRHNLVSSAINKIQELILGVSGSTESGINVSLAPYNAVLNGVTDDTTAFEDAIIAAGANGIVFVPDGTLIWSGNTPLPTGITIRGRGPNRTTIKLKNGSNADGFILAASASRVKFEHLTLDGNKANNPTVGSAVTDTPAVASGFDKLQFIDCIVKNWNRGTEVQGTGWSGNQTLFNTWFIDNKLWGYQMCTDSEAVLAFVGENGKDSIGDAQACNIYWTGWKARMLGCHLWQSRRNILGYYANYNSVTACQIEETKEEAIILTGRGNGWSINGNVFQRIATGMADSVTPPGVANTYDAIVLETPAGGETCSGNSIKNNTFNLDDDNPVKFRYAINEQSGCDSNDFAGNIYNNCYTVAPIKRSGSNTVVDVYDAPGPSGFKRRTLGETGYLGRLEVATTYYTAAAPAGDKPNIILERIDEAGILRNVWVALSSLNADGHTMMEDSGLIQIFIDDDTTAKVSLSVNDFFCYAPEGGEFHTLRVGSMHRDYGEVIVDRERSAYRYLHMPYRKYCRVEYVNQSGAGCTLWAQAAYSKLANPYLNPEHLDYRIYKNEQAAHPKQTPLTVIDEAVGPGQLESFWLSISSANAGDIGFAEGNLEIYINGDSHPCYMSTGGEDVFHGGFYDIQPGAYPAGRAGNSLLAGTRYNWYKFFLDDPIYFDSNIKVVWNVGQQSQGSMASATVAVGGFVGLWLNDPPSVNFTKSGDNQLSDDFTSYGAGDIGAPWTQPGAGKWQGGSNVATFTDGAATDNNPCYRSASGQDYWTQGSFQINNAGAGAEVFLFARAGTGSYNFADRVAIELYRDTQYNWQIRLRDGFDTVMIVKIDEGVDLINTWIDLALLVKGTKVKGYWRKNGDTVWQSVGSWTTAKVGTGCGFATWTAQAKADNFSIKDLEVVTE